MLFRSYTLLRDSLVKGTPSVCKLITNKQDLTELSLYEEDLILKNNKIVVPAALRQQVLELSHMSHPAFDRNYKHLTKYFYWPNMTNDIKIHTKNCPQCIEYATKQPANPIKLDEAYNDKHFGPFSHLGMDVCTYDGKNYLIIVCRYSGYPIIEPLNSLTTKTIIEKLWSNIIRYGIPIAIRSDGARYFVSEEMLLFCKTNGIRLEQSSSYYAPSNGLAEAAVKNMKNLLKKTTTYKQFQAAYMAYVNTVRKDGTIPTQLFLGRQIRTLLPIHPKNYQLTDIKDIKNQELKKKEYKVKIIEERNKDRKNILKPLNIGQEVYIQGINDKWTQKGVITDIRRTGSYVLESNGKKYIRARHFLRPVEKAAHTYKMETDKQTTALKSIIKRNNANANPKRVTFGKNTAQRFRVDAPPNQTKRAISFISHTPIGKVHHCFAVNRVVNTRKSRKSRGTFGHLENSKMDRRFPINYEEVEEVNHKTNRLEKTRAKHKLVLKQGRRYFEPDSITLTINADLFYQNGFSNELRDIMSSLTRKVDFLTAMYPRLVRRYDIDRQEENEQENNHVMSDGTHFLQYKVHSRLMYVPYFNKLKKYKAGSYVCRGNSGLTNTFTGQGKKKEGKARLRLPITGKIAREETPVRIPTCHNNSSNSNHNSSHNRSAFITQCHNLSLQPSRRPSCSSRPFSSTFRPGQQAQGKAQGQAKNKISVSHPSSRPRHPFDSQPPRPNLSLPPRNLRPHRPSGEISTGHPSQIRVGPRYHQPSSKPNRKRPNRNRPRSSITFKTSSIRPSYRRKRWYHHHTIRHLQIPSASQPSRGTSSKVRTFTRIIKTPAKCRANNNKAHSQCKYQC